MPLKIFISYRRSDSASPVLAIHQWLLREFGSALLFMDVDSIPLGAKFNKVLRDAVGNCDVLLAVIGREWVDVRGGDGKRRLDDLNDYVRIEIAAALRRHIPVIPILIDDAEMPKAAELPKSLRKVVDYQGLPVRHATFRSDMDALVRGIKALDKTVIWSEELRQRFDMYGVVEVGQPVTILRQPRMRATASGFAVVEKGVVVRIRDRKRFS
jgi:hypothetical protein